MFNVLRRIFSKNIIPDNDINRYLVYMYPLKSKKVRINSKLDIPSGFSVAVVVNGRVLDVLSSGKHKVNGSTMPETFQKLRLGKPNKRGRLKKQFKAQVYFVNLKTFTAFNYTSNNPFVVRGEKFGRIRGFGEGVADVSIDSAEELINYLLRDYSRVNNKIAHREIGVLVGNSVNKLLEKSKLKFSDILLKPESLYPFLNPSVNDILSPHGIQADNVKLMSLKLSKKMQRKVNEFLSNRANFSGLDEDWSVDLTEEEQTQESVQMFENINPGLEAPMENAQPNQAQPETYVAPQTVSVQQEASQINPLLKRRLSSAAILDQVKGDTATPTADINASAVLGSDNNLKQCKYCGQTIDMHYKYCPKCGFKQN